MEPRRQSESDITIEQIESDIRDAKFAALPAEEYLTERGRLKLMEYRLANDMSSKTSNAYMAGYKAAKAERSQMPFILGMALGSLASFALVFITVAA